jgi:type IV secretion system protein VirB10
MSAHHDSATETARKPEPPRPVRLNRKTVLMAGVSCIAVLFLGLNLGLRGFSGNAEPPTGPSEENLLLAPKSAVRIPEVDYGDVTGKNLPTPEPAKEEPKVPDPEPSTKGGTKTPPGPGEEQLAAWSSPLFPPSAQALRQAQPPAASGGNALGDALARLADLDLPTPQDLFPKSQPSMSERNEAFLQAGADGDVTLQQSLQQPVSPFEIKAGSIIPAALLTGLNSDLPGQIVGQVTEPVYDTVTGQYLLIPQGTKITGRYNANIGYAQNRLQIVWDRLIMPNGSSIGLEAMVGTDKTGAAGLEDRVDYHLGSLAGAVLLSSIIGAGANLATDSSADGGFVDDLGDAAAQQAAQVGSEIVRRQLDVQPTITVRPGFKLNILVGRDIILEPYP